MRDNKGSMKDVKSHPKQQQVVSNPPPPVETHCNFPTLHLQKSSHIRGLTLFLFLILLSFALLWEEVEDTMSNQPGAAEPEPGPDQASGRGYRALADMIVRLRAAGVIPSFRDAVRALFAFVWGTMALRHVIPFILECFRWCFGMPRTQQQKRDPSDQEEQTEVGRSNTGVLAESVRRLFGMPSARERHSHPEAGSSHTGGGNHPHAE